MIIKMKKYDSYKDSGVDWIGMIPSHWDIKRIKHTTYVKGRIGWQGMRSGEFCVYVLKCKDGSFYKGQTNDFPRRMKEHEKGEVSWTSKNLPFEIIHWEVFETRDEVVKREDYLKSGLGREWLQKSYENKTLKVFERQADAWVDETKTNIGYEINFTKYFLPIQTFEVIG
jgi:predicted GIY-YIG superfamily endonuclease